MTRRGQPEQIGGAWERAVRSVCATCSPPRSAMSRIVEAGNRALAAQERAADAPSPTTREQARVACARYLEACEPLLVVARRDLRGPVRA